MTFPTFDLPPSDNLDPVRVDFLADLDDASHITVTDWESSFLESVLGKTTFTPKQRESIDSMREKYRNQL